jgi:hypothetical protein
MGMEINALSGSGEFLIFEHGSLNEFEHGVAGERFRLAESA